MEFPSNFGFKYSEEYNEWQKVRGDGILLIIWERSNIDWELSYLDKDDNMISMCIGDEDYIIDHFLNHGKSY